MGAVVEEAMQKVPLPASQNAQEGRPPEFAFYWHWLCTRPEKLLPAPENPGSPGHFRLTKAHVSVHASGYTHRCWCLDVGPHGGVCAPLPLELLLSGSLWALSGPEGLGDCNSISVNVIHASNPNCRVKLYEGVKFTVHEGPVKC